MTKNYNFRLLPLAAAMLAAFGSANAQDDEVTALTKPESSVSIGVGSINTNQDAKRFGQYRGLSDSGAYGLVDLDLIKRDDTTGTWMILQGRDLGLDTRELGFTHQKQGDWKYTVEYSEMVRRDPYTIHTGMTGIGTANPTINLINKPPMPAAWATANGLQADNGVVGSDQELKIKRTALGVSAEKWLNSEFQVEGNVRTEERKGARLFGRAGLTSSDMGSNPTIGTGNANGSWAVLLTPEPINSKTSIFEGKLSFNRDKLAVTGGYYGSIFVNEFGTLTPSVPGTLNRGVLWNGVAGSAQTVQQIASSPVALPPDNQAQQLYVSGTYAYSPATRMNFKVSYTNATQNEGFVSQGLTPATNAPASLSGEVNTTLALLGLTSRVTKDFTVNASLRYEDRADKTPINVYNTNGVGTNAGLNNTTNFPSASQTRTTAKLDGIYRFLNGYSALLGLDWENKKTPLAPSNTALFNNQVMFREQLNESGVRAELRKALSETVNGTVGVEYKERRGNDDAWVTTSGVVANQNALVPVVPSITNRVLPDMYMDRDRTKVRGSVDWAALEQLDLQAIYEHSEDVYKRQAPSSLAGVATPIIAGARDMFIDSMTLDGAYIVSDNWKVNAYWTASEYRWNVNKASIGDDTRSSAQTMGLGVKTKLTGHIDAGVDLFVYQETTRFSNQPVVAGVVTNIAGWTGQSLPGNYLPSITYNSEVLRVFVNYAVDKSSDVRLDATAQHFKTDDWQWGYNGVPFVYSDNTTVSQPMEQNLLFVTARYVYRF